MNKIWRTKRGSKVQLVDGRLRIQARDRETSRDLTRLKVREIIVSRMQEGTHCTTIVFGDYNGVNLGRYEFVEDALALYQAISEYVDEHGAWA